MHFGSAFFADAQQLLRAEREADQLLNVCQPKLNATVVETSSGYHVEIVPVLSSGLGVFALLFVEESEVPICICI